MVLTYVVAQTRPGMAARFEHAIRGIVDDARRLAGCVRSEWYRDPDVPEKYVMVGEFDSMTHFTEYRRSDVVRRIGAELLPLLAGKPMFRHYEAEVFESSQAIHP